MTIETTAHVVADENKDTSIALRVDTRGVFKTDTITLAAERHKNGWFVLGLGVLRDGNILTVTISNPTL